MNFDVSDKLRNGNSETTFIILTFEESSKNILSSNCKSIDIPQWQNYFPPGINNSDINSKNNFSDYEMVICQIHIFI